MPRLWRLATGNWWTNPGRTFAAILSVALGVGTVVITTNAHETAFRAITDGVIHMVTSPSIWEGDVVYEIGKNIKEIA